MAKYKNRKTVVDGITFDSRKEANRYKELRLLEKAGEITDLELQKSFELIPAQYETFERYGKRGQRLKDGRRCIEKAVTYKSDFCYRKDGELIVEDTKGFKTDKYILKRKMLLYFHGIRIKEI